MIRYAALLRGIAPSGKNQTNDKLRGVFEGLGLAKVGSVLASGNIVFASDDTDVPALEDRIERALQSELGIGGRTIIRSLPDLSALLATEPFGDLTHARGTYLTATFLKGTVAPTLPSAHSEGLTRVVGYDPAARVVLAVTDNSNPGQTPDFMVWLERQCGKDITTRTWLTIQRIVKKLESL